MKKSIFLARFKQNIKNPDIFSTDYLEDAYTAYISRIQKYKKIIQNLCDLHNIAYETLFDPPEIVNAFFYEESFRDAVEIAAIGRHEYKKTTRERTLNFLKNFEVSFPIQAQSLNIKDIYKKTAQLFEVMPETSVNQELLSPTFTPVNPTFSLN
jgi:hypothetical protein